jgi:DNA polymerase beta thumb
MLPSLPPWPGAEDARLSPESLRRDAGLVLTAREEDIYKSLGLPFIPPELREGADEIALAGWDALPELISLKVLRGILHLHTIFSDGVNTLEGMAEAAHPEVSEVEFKAAVREQWAILAIDERAGIETPHGCQIASRFFQILSRQPRRRPASLMPMGNVVWARSCIC